MEYKWFKAGEEDSSYVDIRTAVFCDEQGYTVEDEFDEDDKNCPHLVIFSDGKPLSTGRVLKVDGETGRIGRIAVVKSMRGTGLGEKTVLELLRYAKEQGYKTILLGAQSYAVGFYEKCGFRLVGTAEYMDGHIPHMEMIQTF